MQRPQVLNTLTARRLHASARVYKWWTQLSQPSPNPWVSAMKAGILKPAEHVGTALHAPW